MKGEYHNLRLLCLRVPFDELRAHVPAPLPLRMYPDGAARVLVTDATLRHVRTGPLGIPLPPVRHVAFRALLDDRPWLALGAAPAGQHLTFQFTQWQPAAWAGGWLTQAVLHTARFLPLANGLLLEHGNQYLRYQFVSEALEPTPSPSQVGSTKLLTHSSQPITAQCPVLWPWGLPHTHSNVYSLRRGRLYSTAIAQPPWPLVPAHVEVFRTNFLPNAVLEAAYTVPVSVPFATTPARRKYWVPRPAECLWADATTRGIYKPLNTPTLQPA